MKRLLFGTIIILFIAGFLAFYRPRSKIEFQVKNIAADTIFHNSIGGRGGDGYGREVSLRSIGEIDDSTEIFIQVSGHSDKFFDCKLPKGKFDTTFRQEYYESEADVHYLHKSAKKGKLKIIFRYLGADLDTLEEMSIFSTKLIRK